MLLSKIKKSVTVVIITMTAVFYCHAIPQKPVPQRLINDFAGIFTYRQIVELETILVEFDDSTSNQIAVVTVNDLEGYAPSEYATRIGLDWQVGSADYNNGIVILIKPKTSSGKGEVAISVGYGLEGAIPDVYCKRIIENEMIPAFKENDYYKGVYDACTVLMKLAKGEISVSSDKTPENSIPGMIIGLFVFIVLLLCIIVIAGKKGGGGNNGGKRNYDDDTIAKSIIIGSILGSRPSGRSGGGFGSGGSFGGFGGGSFGGGGSSGSW